MALFGQLIFRILISRLLMVRGSLLMSHGSRGASPALGPGSAPPSPDRARRDWLCVEVLRIFSRVPPKLFRPGRDCLLVFLKVSKQHARWTSVWSRFFFYQDHITTIANISCDFPFSSRSCGHESGCLRIVLGLPLEFPETFQISPSVIRKPVACQADA